MYHDGVEYIDCEDPDPPDLSRGAARECADELIAVAELAAAWPRMPDLGGGIDMFAAEHGEPTGAGGHDGGDDDDE